MTPITRREIYYAKIAGEYDGAIPTPHTRMEMYLAYLAGDASVVIPEPVTIEEKYWFAACVGDKANIEPKTRRHIFLNAITAENKEVPQPITREETYLSKIVKAYSNYEPFENDPDVVGLQIDYETGTFTRLAAAKEKEAGEDFDEFPMYGGRKRCILTDDGKIVAWYGDDGFVEDGSSGQVMVYQPKFYYRIVPLKVSPNTPFGLILEKANYFVSAKKKPGFKLHPAFYNGSGHEVGHIFQSAYEGGLVDDKIVSVSSVTPTTLMTISDYRDAEMARGNGWNQETVKSYSSLQLLMVIELAALDIQAVLGSGISVNSPVTNTGQTSGLGNKSGMANELPEYSELANGACAVSYRGQENPYGNIWKYIDGVNIYGDGKMNCGQLYICEDQNFESNKNSENYESSGILLGGSINFKFGYDNKFDWLFFPSVNASVRLQYDKVYATANKNGFNIVLSGGMHSDGTNNGAFCYELAQPSTYKANWTGCRLTYTPND